MGINLNRNWGIHWNGMMISIDESHPCSNNYRGIKPFSEIEVRNVRDFLLKHQEQIKFYNTLHSYSQLILFPRGYSNETIPNYDKYMQMANKVSDHTLTSLTLCTSYFLYSNTQSF